MKKRAKDMERLNLKKKNVDKNIENEIIKIREDNLTNKKETLKYNNEIITLLKSIGRQNIIEDAKKIKYCNNSWLDRVLIKFKIKKKR